MIGRLTLSLRRYDPAANDELTFGDITRSLRFGYSNQTENERTVKEDRAGEDDRVREDN